MSEAGIPSRRLAPPLARYGLPAAIVLLVLICFLPVLKNQFVNWDDADTLTANLHYRGLSPSHLAWMFTTLHMGHYQPLAWLTHALVYTLWGMDPFGYHLVNLLLHAANAVLFYWFILLLFRLLRPQRGGAAWSAEHCAALVGALLFAIHPLRVEPVAWATERREVLCGFFLLLTVAAYLRMQEEKRAGRTGRVWFVVSLLCYTFSLLSKAMSLTLPVVLLVLDVYPLGRFAGKGRGAILIEKLPYVAVALAIATVAAFGVQHQAAVPLSQHGVMGRMAQAAYGLSFYLWKTVAPVRLSALYFLDLPVNPTAWKFTMSALIVVAITGGAIALRRRYPWVLTAWACYVVIASPVLGFVQSGPQLVADRYTYLSCLPWAVLASAGIYRLSRQWELGRLGTSVAVSAGAVVVAVLVTLGILTFRQTRVWKDSLALWNQVLEIEPTNCAAYNNRGHARQDTGDLSGALADYDTAIRLNPTYADAYASRGHARDQTGDRDGALTDYTIALRLDPTLSVVYNNRGSTRQSKGDLPGALTDYNQALRLDPGYAHAYYNRGSVRQAQGDVDGALADFTSAIGFNPQYAEAYTNRGTVRQAKGDLDGALADFNQAIQIASENATAYFNRANARKAKGDFDGAIADYSVALRLDSRFVSAYNNRGSARKVTGDLDGALADFTQAVELTAPEAPRRPVYERNLAAIRRQLAERSANR